MKGKKIVAWLLCGGIAAKVLSPWGPIVFQTMDGAVELTMGAKS